MTPDEMKASAKSGGFGRDLELVPTNRPGIMLLVLPVVRAANGGRIRPATARRIKAGRTVEWLTMFILVRQVQMPRLPSSSRDSSQSSALSPRSCSARDRPGAMPNVSSACAEPSRCNMTNWMPRLAVLAIATSLLAACATARSDGGVCPPVVSYSREFLARAADELERLPPGSTIEQMLADYQVMREQARACELR